VEPKVAVDIAPDSVPMGAKNAPLTLVEFSDYQCTFCRKFHVETLPELKKRFVDSGRLRIYSRDMPLSFHSNAFKAAVAARCAGEQGRFWELRDVMVANASNLAPDNIVKFAQALNINIEPFKQCLNSTKYDSAIQGDTAEAGKIGIEGTPSFVLGRSTPGGVEGIVVVGAQPLAKFLLEIEKLK
jgi:protein-disulfide isomerase